MSGNKSFGFHFTFSLKLQTDGEKTQNKTKKPSDSIFVLALKGFMLYLVLIQQCYILHFLCCLSVLE